ncbi:MAG: hypothetical protein ACI38Q_01670 [Candidatus Bruticola sp.]
MAVVCLSLSACTVNDTAQNANQTPTPAKSSTADKTENKTAKTKAIDDEKIDEIIANQPKLDKKDLSKDGYCIHEKQKVTDGVSNGAEWQYIVMNDEAYKTFVNNNPSWFSQDFNSKVWGIRNAPMGNVIKTNGAELDPASQISWNDNSNNLLLRRVFNAKDPSIYKNTSMNIFCGSEMEVYVNNVLVYSDMGKNKKTADKYNVVKFDKAPNIVQGNNIISIHLKSTDKNKEFDMSLTTVEPTVAPPGPAKNEKPADKAKNNPKDKTSQAPKATKSK